MKLDSQIILDFLYPFPERYVPKYYRWQEWSHEYLNIYLAPYDEILESERGWHIQVEYINGKRNYIYVTTPSQTDFVTKYWCAENRPEGHQIESEDAEFIEQFLKWGTDEVDSNNT